MEHPNFYENLNEAIIRLRGCVILYDQQPYYILAITPDPDGIFRVFLGPIGRKDRGQRMDWPTEITENYGWEHPDTRKALDDWLKKKPESGVLRKQMNSPLFNKFRPFPLGMCNNEGGVSYLERQPLRPNTCQGLTRNMICENPLSLSPTGSIRGKNTLDFWSAAFKDCILAQHPSAKTCLDNLKSGKYVNEGVAFHRHFAFLKGPIDTMFLAYRSNVIGMLPDGDLSRVVLGREYPHCQEVVEELGIFNRVM